MSKTQQERSLERIQELKKVLIAKEGELERASTVRKAVKEERDKAEQRLFYAIDHADQEELTFDLDKEDPKSLKKGQQN